MPPTAEAQLPVFWDDAFLEYRMPDGAAYLSSSPHVAFDEPHPERPERLQNIRHVIERNLADHVDWRPAPRATTDQLSAVHDPGYVADLEGTYADDPGRVTADTWVDESMLRAARLAAGAAVAAADHAVAGDPGVPYALVRPSGHHAQPAHADGFCLFNNVAVAAAQALDSSRVDHVAIVDWDVHHGNGTQEVFYDREDVLVVSVHNDFGPWDPEAHPQTGRPDEHGTGDGEGYTVNVPVPGGTGDRGYGRVVDRVVAPVVADFDPDLLLVSAGQDPGVADPMGRNALSKAGFRELGRRVCGLADAHAAGRLALVQEGGYHLSHLPFATLGVLEGVLGVDTGVTDSFAGWNEDLACLDRALDEVVDHYARYWSSLGGE